RKTISADSLARNLDGHVEAILEDLRTINERRQRQASCHVQLADARFLPVNKRRYSAVISSPPYPNRHDYTRVFGVELMFGFCTWSETRTLRYQTFHSHPEARPKRPKVTGYEIPPKLRRALSQIRQLEQDRRVVKM